jgi:hypothetical protein
MQLNPNAFNAHLANIGQQVSWRQSHNCPCINPHSGAAKPGCPVCGGRGRFWDPAVAGVIGIANQQVQKRWAQMGRYEAGDAVVTVPENSAVYDAGQFDRVLMLNSTDRFSVSLMHGASNERLYYSLQSVDRVFWLTNGGLPLVEGGIPTVADNGVLTWSSGEPPAGMTYTIEGSKFSEYFVFDSMPSDRNEHSGARLPRKIVLRNFDLYGRAGDNS